MHRKTTCILLILCIYSCAPQTADPDRPHFEFHSNHPQIGFSDLRSSVLEVIRSAERSIDIAVYGFADNRIAGELRRAADRGVRIRIVGDQTESDEGSYRVLHDAGFVPVTGNPGAIQHNKFIIADDDVLLTGSSNFTPGGLDYDDNHILVIHSRELCDVYRMEFEVMFSGRFGRDKPASGPVTVLVGDSPVTVVFLPSGQSGLLTVFNQEIQAATESVHYMIFAFTLTEIADMLRSGSHRLRILGVHDSDFVSGMIAEDFVNFPGPGMVIRQDGNYVYNSGESSGGKLHTKAMVIDPGLPTASLLTGSFNWSNSAVRDNDENLLVIRDPEIVNQAYRQWERVWFYSRPITKGDTP